MADLEPVGMVHTGGDLAPAGMVQQPQPPGFLAGAAHAVAERGMGLAQSVSHLLGPIPETAMVPTEALTVGGIPPAQISEMAKRTVTPQQVDADVRKIEGGYQARRQAGGPSAATRAGEIVGGVATDMALTAPLAGIGAGAGGFVAAVARGLGIGATAGAIGGAAQPVTDTEHFGRAKTEQMGVGAATGAAIGGPLGALGRAIAKGDPAEAATAIRSAYYRGVKPAGTMTAPQRDVYENQMRQAVDAIIDTRGGKPLPRSPEDFSQAVAETKSSLYGTYSGMAKEAGAGGARVKLQDAADRLRQLAANPLQDPAATAEAKRLLALHPPGRNATITPERAEEVMHFLNERATGFDTQGTKGAGSIFREAARVLRESLIEAVEGAGFPQYGALRRTYGSLISIEDDVGRATGRELSKGGAQIGLSEIGAAGLAGAGEPASAAAVEGGKLLSRFFKSPNRAITKLFEEAASLRRDPSLTEKVGAALPSLAAPAAGAVGGAAASTLPSRMPPQLRDLPQRIQQQRQQQQQPTGAGTP